MQNVDEGGRAVPTDWSPRDANEPTHGTSLGEKEMTFGDLRFRCRGWQSQSAGQTLETWVAFNDDGVVFPGPVLVTRAGTANIKLVEVLEPKD